MHLIYCLVNKWLIDSPKDTPPPISLQSWFHKEGGGGGWVGIFPQMMTHAHGPIRLCLFERVVWEKMDPEIELAYGRPPRYIIMRTTLACLINADTWCPDCMNHNKICVFHEKRVPRRRFIRMREHQRYE